MSSFKILNGDPTIVAANLASAAYEGLIGQRVDTGELWQVQGAAWVKLQGASSTGALINLANIAAMQALPAATLLDGTPVWVRTVQRVFFLTTTAAGAAAANDTYTSTVAGRLWMGSDVSNYNFWRSQATWVIDPVSGNDESTGVDLAHAIKTCAERRRRCGRSYTVPQPTTITYQSSPPASDPETFSRVFTGAGATLTLLGNRTPLATGTLTGFTAFNRATQTTNIANDTGLAGGFAAHVGRLMRITSGPRVNSTWVIVRDLGGGAAEISTPGITDPSSFGSFSRLAPQIGDAYEIVSLPVVTCGEASFGQGSNQYPTTGFGRVIAQDIQFDFGNLSTTSFAAGFIADFVKLTLVRCRFGASYFRGGNVSLFQCFHNGYALIESGSVQMKAGAHTTHVQANAGGRVHLDYDELFEGGQITVFRGGYAEVGTACVFNKGGSAGAGVNAGGTLLCSPGGDGVTALWGTGNGTQGVSVDAGGQLVWWAGTGGAKPTINAGLGLGRELRLGERDILWADAPVEAGGAVAGTFS